MGGSSFVEESPLWKAHVWLPWPAVSQAYMLDVTEEGQQEKYAGQYVGSTNHRGYSFAVHWMHSE